MSTSFEAEFTEALVHSLNHAGAFVKREFRVPGTTSMSLNIYVASPARAFIELKLQSSLTPLDTKHLLVRTSELYHLFSRELVPILIVADKSWQSLPHDTLKHAGLLVLTVDTSSGARVTAERSAKEIWDFLIGLPYQYKGFAVSTTEPTQVRASIEPTSDEILASIRRNITQGSIAPSVPSSMAGSVDITAKRPPVDIFTDVLISLQSILTVEQFELAAFSGEYYHAHYTACAWDAH
jgi:hypothetical protein